MEKTMTKEQADAQAQINALKEKLAAAKEAKKQEEWLAKYPHVVKGSIRKAEGISTGKKGHGKVCTIRCEMCKAERTINVQDAFQVRYCSVHAELAKKIRQKDKREEKKLAKLSPEAVKAELARLNGLLANLEGKKVEETEEASAEELEALAELEAENEALMAEMGEEDAAMKAVG